MNSWDSSQVSYSQYSTDPNAQQDEGKILRQKFREFLRTYKKHGTESMMTGYREQLSMNYNQGKYFVEIDYQDLLRYDKMLAEKLRKEPEQTLPKFEKAAKEAYLLSRYDNNKSSAGEIHNIQIQIINYRRTAETIRNLDSDMVSQLVQAPGIIISASRVAARATRMRIQCSGCKTERWVVNEKGFGHVQFPRKCEGTGNNVQGNNQCGMDPFIMVPDKTEYVDTQRLKLQENPEDVPTGEMPRHLWLSMDRNFVDQVKPGSRVNVIGIYSIYSAKGSSKKGQDKTIRQPYLRVIGVEMINASEAKGSFEPDEEDALRKLARSGDIYNKLINRLLHLYGVEKKLKELVHVYYFVVQENIYLVV